MKHIISTNIIASIAISLTLVSTPQIALGQTAQTTCDNGGTTVDSTCLLSNTWSTRYLNNQISYGPAPGPINTTPASNPSGSTGATDNNRCNKVIQITSNTTLTVPNTCPNLRVHWAVAGGGSGGNGEQQSNGASGGGGGSGGYIEEQTFSLTPNGLLNFSIGSGGQRVTGDAYAANNAPQAGGNTTIKYNGTTIVNLTGGQPGTSGLDADNAKIVYGIYANVAGTGGDGGSPNGQNGENGSIGHSPKTGTSPTNGGNGASDPQGTGGSGGTAPNSPDGNDASGYGAGGGGGANADGSTQRFIWFGGAGSPGAINIEFT